MKNISLTNTSHSKNKKHLLSRRGTHALLLGVLLLTSFLLKLNHLGHSSLVGVDESCHAVVAKNLLKHPLKPTLIETPYLHYFEEVWGGNHIWLHKPVLPLWQSAFSMWLLGINTFAFRLPSAILSTLAVWITYLIGVELLSKRAALIAATAQAFSMFVMRVTHGYLFSDVMDISLLFYCELGIYGVIRTVKTGLWRYVLLAGIGQGLAFLSKTYPAFIVSGVALAGVLAPSFRLAKKEDCLLKSKHFFVLLGVTLIVAGPWMLFTAIAYPIEFNISNRVTFSHFTEDIQGWGAPWYQVLLYTRDILSSFTIPTVLAILCTLPRLFRGKDVSICLLYAWGFGVFPPFLIATTKIPCATLMGAPALLLLLGAFVERTTHAKKDVPRWRGHLRKCWAFYLILLFFGEAFSAWWITNINDQSSSLPEIASYVETHLPKNAVLLTEENNEKTEHYSLYLMFQTSHTAYPYHSEAAWEKISKRIQQRGGIPYLVTFRELPLPVVFKSESDRRIIYATLSDKIQKTSSDPELPSVH